ncbi:glycosyltransferase 87 family protein [Psychroserpens sp. XS_ASV72]|uniref:glycosyltransferase 87 family protein n=1 Tax=Psychroserpens sp. XS_ASV72 TaxID=3241293 RepID=UPI003515D747
MVSLKFHKIPLVLTIVSLLLYFVFAYDLVRTEYTKLLLIYGLLWAVFITLIRTVDNLKYLSIISFLSRAVFILAIPNLSQDFYRFIWDGRLLLEGFNPYLYTPESFIQFGNFPIAQANELYAGMGNLNASHFTNYPPIHQLGFVIAGLFSGHSILGSVMVLRVLIIAADFGILIFGKRLLKQFNLSEKHIFWYILNPFIIIELTGNLHFEGVMVFFLIWSLYLLHQNRWQWAAIVFGLSISVKLMPLLFLPLFLKYFKKDSNSKIDFKRLVSFYLVVGLTIIILFIPFFNFEFIQNYTQTVALWFNNFEFNASIYYVVREIGYLFRGYNEIAIIGKILSAIILLIVLVLSLRKNNSDIKILIRNMLIAFTIYLFLSTTVHPWYVTTLLALSIFTNYKYPIVWSAVIILSYLAYLGTNKADKSENLWLIAMEYVIVYGFFIWELFFKTPTSTNKKSQL